MTTDPADRYLPRLFVEEGIEEGRDVLLSPEQGHYLKTVLRRLDGSRIRIVHPESGEWVGTLSFHRKKDVLVHPLERIRLPERRAFRVHLIFSPLKKDRMDFLVEKATELGVTDFHPALMQRSSVREIKEDRLLAQMREASEQCERLDLPRLLPIRPLPEILGCWDFTTPIWAAIERLEDFLPLPPPCSFSRALLVGPEGGFAEEEVDDITARVFVTPFSLGPRILRAETAALAGLVLQNSLFTR